MDSSMFNGIFDGIYKMIISLIVLCVIFVPLGVWKAIEIIIWVSKHIHWE